jgi:hypothetical protein
MNNYLTKWQNNWIIKYCVDDEENKNKLIKVEIWDEKKCIEKISIGLREYEDFEWNMFIIL